MTKKEVLDQFRREILPWQDYLDLPAKRESWNNYTDMLCKEGAITMRQYESWTNPY